MDDLNVDLIQAHEFARKEALKGLPLEQQSILLQAGLCCVGCFQDVADEFKRLNTLVEKREIA